MSQPPPPPPERPSPLHAPPPPVQPPYRAAPPPRSNRRRWLIVGVILALLLGSCGALVATGAFVGFRAMTAPVDVANDYLDAAREGGDVTAHTCGVDVRPPAYVIDSSAQNLTNVSISGGRASVDGTVDVASGHTSQVRIRLTRRDGEWCVVEVSL